ncbi:MAG: hypothetical protein K2W33_08275, partial [Burkholderiales bacterium]|nr:hypothetical protein [Burkholderiales bacterium]
RTVAQTETRLDQRSALQDDIRVHTAFLRQVLGHVSAAEKHRKAFTDAPTVYFYGGTDRVDWVGIMPARPGAGGRYFFSFGFKPGDEGTFVPVLSFAPWVPDVELAQVVHTDQRTLFQPVKQYRIRYADRNSQAEPVWSENWATPEKLPELVRIDFDTGQAPGMAPLIIALRPLAASKPPRSIFSSGPGS